MSEVSRRGCAPYFLRLEDFLVDFFPAVFRLVDFFRVDVFFLVVLFFIVRFLVVLRLQDFFFAGMLITVLMNLIASL